MKQTAVEWLVETMQKQIDAGYGFSPKHEEEIINQAKAMEKEQIMNAHKDNAVVYEMDANGQAEQYYNETYNK